MKIRLSFIVTLFVIPYFFTQQCLKGSVFLPSMPQCPQGDYYLVFEDNFDGNTLDLTTWNPITGVPRDFNFESQKAWHLPENIEVSNGTLKIIAKKLTSAYSGTWVTDWNTSPPTTQTSDFNYTTGEIWTHEKFLFGKYEARCRVPAGKGYWPAFWTFGSDQRWNEIDIFELYGDDMDRFTCNVHHDFDGDGDSESCHFAQNNAVNSFAEWHTFTCIYEFDKIIWQIDGVTIRVLHRFSTLTGSVISCEDQDLAMGTYFMEQAFPVDSMHIVFNLAIQSGGNSPDQSTVFPGVFEVDYLRYYKKIVDPCIGCIDHIIYENTNQLPELTRTSNYIKAGDNTTVQNGQNIRFRSPLIIIDPTFEVAIGANFSAIPEECNLLNYEDVSISFIGSNAIDGYQILTSTNPIYTIEATGVLFYSFKVFTLGGQLVHSTSGAPTSNHISLWNASNIPTAWYKVRLELSNCTDSDVREYNLFVLNDSKSLITTSDSTEVNEDSYSEQSTKLFLYPNPTSESLNIFIDFSKKNVSNIQVIDMIGNIRFNRNTLFNSGVNNFVIDVSQLPVGTYTLKVTNEFESLISSFIIN